MKRKWELDPIAMFFIPILALIIALFGQYVFEKYADYQARHSHHWENEDVR